MVNKGEMIDNRMAAEEREHLKKGQMKKQVSRETTEVKIAEVNSTEVQIAEVKTAEETVVLIRLINTSRSNVTSTTLTKPSSWFTPSLSTGSLSPQLPFWLLYLLSRYEKAPTFQFKLNFP